MPPKHSDQFVRDVSLQVYMQRLDKNDKTPDAIERMGGMAGVRKRAAIMDTLTRCYLRALNIEEPKQGENWPPNKAKKLPGKVRRLPAKTPKTTV